MLSNGIEFPLAWLAIAKMGAVMVPVNVQYREQELQYVLNHSEAKLAVAGMQQVEVLQRAQPQCNFLREMAILANEVRSSNNVVDLRSEKEAKVVDVKDMVRRSGENISAAEVEGVLCEHPAVRATAVVPVPDDLRGEEVKAFIQLQDGATLDPEELLAFAQKKLAAFKMPRFIEFVAPPNGF